MFTVENPDRLAEKKAGCASFGIQFLKLLVSLFVVGVAVLLLLPNPNIGDLSKSRIRHIEQHTMASLAAGVSQFHTEYGLRSAKDDLTTTDATFMRPLLALDDTLNPRRIKFVDFPTAKDGRFGLTGNPPTLVDSWGQPYHIILDTNKDGVITNPEAGANPKAEPTLKTRAAIYSSGPDRDPKTWQDNITNWR